MNSRRHCRTRVGQATLLVACLGGDVGRSAHAQTAPAKPAPTLPERHQEEYEEVPQPPARQPIIGLIIGGSSTVGATWALSVLTAGICDLWNLHFNGGTTDAAGTPKCDTWPLYIPVVGPWLSLAVVHVDHSSSGFGDTLLALDGIFQAAGLAMIIGGAVGRVPSSPFAQNSLQITPLTLRSGVGVLVSGRF